MKITNKMAAYALILSFLIVGSLFAFGMTNLLFTPIYFILISITLFFAALTIKEIFKSGKDIVFVIIILFIMAGSFTILAGSAKAYVDNRNNFMSQYQNLTDEINTINSTNKYYTGYTEYLNQMLNASRSNTLKMQEQLNALILGGNNQEKTTAQIVTPPQPVVEERREYSDEYEEDDDD